MNNKEKQKNKKVKEDFKKNLEKKIEEDFGKEMLKKITILT
jgi:hypothetical protein|tara:strand:+ start:358 stop:480 length:123 start_codon:yes stop_codon:yes gene_type:complete